MPKQDDKTLDEALADVREAMRAPREAYVAQQMDTEEEAAYDAAWYARKCAEYWRKDRDGR